MPHSNKNKKTGKKITDFFQVYKADTSVGMELPLYVSGISAGFPSPADDYIEQKLDLNKFLVRHPSATFYVKAKGNSMIDAGIRDGDILIVDRALNASDNNIVICILDDEFTVKRIKKIKGKLFLVPENKNYEPVEIKDGMNFSIWGVVTTVIHHFV